MLPLVDQSQVLFTLLKTRCSYLLWTFIYLFMCFLQSTRSKACRLQQLQLTGLVAPWHVQSSWTRGWTHIPWIASNDNLKWICLPLVLRLAGEVQWYFNVPILDFDLFSISEYCWGQVKEFLHRFIKHKYVSSLAKYKLQLRRF